MLNDRKGLIFRWLNPEILLGLPGDFFVGYFLAAYSSDAAGPNIPACCVYVFLLAMSLAGLIAAAKGISGGFALCSAIYRVAAVLVGAAIAGIFINWPVAIVAVLFGLYGLGCGRAIELSQHTRPAKLGKYSVLIWVVAFLSCVYAILVAYGEHSFGLWFWFDAWFVVWFFVRTNYFCRALKGYNSPDRLRQGAGLFIRGVLMLQGMLLVAFLPDMKALVAFIAVFITINVQTLACRIIR